MTPVQELAAAASWLGMQHEDLSAGLKSAEDGLKLWRYAQALEVMEMPFSDTALTTPTPQPMALRHVRAAVGYNPWSRAAATEG